MNTVWAMLFLTKSTAKTLRRIQIQRLGAGTLLGGRGLPKDLSSMTVAGGRVVSRPMNGAIEGMLAVLEDPRAEQADAAVAGLVERYYREGPAVLRPFKPRFRKMLADRDPGVRRVAAWALAHTGDMDVVPAADRRAHGPRRGRRRLRAAGPPAPQPQDRGPGPAQPLDSRAAHAPPPSDGATGTTPSGRSISTTDDDPAPAGSGAGTGAATDGRRRRQGVQRR